MSIILDHKFTELPPVAKQSCAGAITYGPPYFLPTLVQVPISTFPDPVALTTGRALFIKYEAFAIDSIGNINGGASKFCGSCIVIGGSPATINNQDQVVFYGGSGGPYITGTILTNGDLVLSLGGTFNYDADVILEITSMRMIGNQ